MIKRKLKLLPFNKTKKCLYCGKVIRYGRKFCRQQCAGSHWRKHLGKSSKPRIKALIESRIHSALKRTIPAIEPCATPMELLGCTIEELKTHLESKFQSGMSWENNSKKRDGWHIDHIRPCSTFDLSQPEHQRICFHFSNLAPMWGSENVRKGGTNRRNTQIYEPRKYKLPVRTVTI